MKNVIAIVVLAALMLSLFSGIVAEEAEAGAGDENYEDHSNEISQGDGEPPIDEDDVYRAEPRTRNKDA